MTEGSWGSVTERETSWTLGCRTDMEGREFQITTSLSLSCFAKERCIPCNNNFRLSDLAHEHVVIWQCFRMKVCYSTPAGTQRHRFPPVRWWRWTIDACYTYSWASVTQPESHPLLGAVQSHPLVSSCPSASIGAWNTWLILISTDRSSQTLVMKFCFRYSLFPFKNCTPYRHKVILRLKETVD